MRRWIWFIIAVGLGFGAGLLYGWVISPVKYVDTTLSNLRYDYHTDYVLMAAEAYRAEGDLDLAARRLAALGDTPPAEIVRQAMIYAAQLQYADSDQELLSQLASALQTWTPPGGALAPMRDDRGPWYLLTGVILGIVLGLAYAWLVSPREFRDTSPASLRGDFKDQYRAMIAAAYVANGNLPRAVSRLERLDEDDVARALAEQAQRTLAEGEDPRAAQALGILAVALGGAEVTPPTPGDSTPAETPASPVPTLTPSSTLPDSVENPTTIVVGNNPLPSPTGQIQNATRTPLSTGTPLPTRTPTTTPGAPFVVLDQAFECVPEIPGLLLRVLAEDDAGEPLPGEEVVVNWEGGEDHFFTGLKPELGAGYADFLMTPGVVYALRMAGGGEIVSDLTAAECETSGGSRYWGSWLVVFSRP